MKYLCYLLPNNEWSGILLYKIIGNFSTGNFKIAVKDLFPMNVGSSAYTEYEYDSDFIKYRMANPDSLDWDLGHVHSHNKMPTFFSGTDTDELKENIENHNYYLSLIVNNAMDTSCKIAFKGKQKIQQNSVFSFDGYNGRLSTIRNNKEVEEETMFTYECEVELEQNFKIKSEFTNRVNVIIENKIAADKKAKELAAKKPATTTPTRYFNHDSYNDFNEGNYRESFEVPVKKASFFTKPEDILEDDELEAMVADCLCQQYTCKKDMDEAFFLANIDYKNKGEKYIAEVGMFFRNMYPAYAGEDEPTEAVLTSVLETLYFYGEDEFPDLTELLALELVGEEVAKQ